MGNYDFEKDLVLGEQGEKMVALYLMLVHDMTFLGYNKDNRFDILMRNRISNEKKTFEVKTDYYVDEHNDTGNMAIEIRHKNKPSGISCTKADVFIYFFRNLAENNIWMIKTSELKSLIKDNVSGLKRVMGGDTKETEILLIPKHKFKNSFYIDEIQVQKKEGEKEHQR
tara:strand:- start:68 stop:574 length:507 start_codon:yes stop_codon:yes gene_type:complete